MSLSSHRNGQSRRHQALDAEREESEIQAGARAEDRVGQDSCAFDLQQNGGVADPGSVNTGIAPLSGARPSGRVKDGALAVGRVSFPELGAVR